MIIANLTVGRKNIKEMHISMTKNQTDFQRALIIGLQNGNYFDGIKVTQAIK